MLGRERGERLFDAADFLLERDHGLTIFMTRRAARHSALQDFNDLRLELCTACAQS